MENRFTILQRGVKVLIGVNEAGMQSQVRYILSMVTANKIWYLGPYFSMISPIQFDHDHMVRSMIANYLA